jgi:hypothetical protein
MVRTEPGVKVSEPAPLPLMVRVTPPPEHPVIDPPVPASEQLEAAEFEIWSVVPDVHDRMYGVPVHCAWSMMRLIDPVKDCVG